MRRPLVADAQLRPNWIGVVLEDIEAQRRFYHDALGLSELGAGDGWVHFDMGFPNIMELLQPSKEPEYDGPRYQVGFATDDIHAACEALVARGVEQVTEIDGGEDTEGYSCYFREVEGNIFELSQRLGSKCE
jgi:predicted enzyme related to lactoylglutathione lyase